MRVFSRLSLFALAPLVSGACRAAGLAAAGAGLDVVARVLSDRLTDHSLRIADALRDAAEQAWRALEVALAGESVGTAFDAADDRAFREQVRLFVLSARCGAGDRDFVPACLDELRAARAAGVLDSGPVRWAEQLGDLTRFADPVALLAAEWRVADELAAELSETGFPALGAFVALRPKHDSAALPLLAVAVRYYFRRAVEDDTKLFQGLTFAQLERIGKAQEIGAARLAEGMARIEGRLGELLASRDEPPVLPVARPAVSADQTNGPVAMSADGRLAVCGSPYDGKVRVIDTTTGKELRRLPGHADWVTCVTVGPDNRTAATGGRDGTVKVWDLVTGRLLRTLSVRDGEPVAVSLTSDRRLAVTVAGGGIRVWNLR